MVVRNDSTAPRPGVMILVLVGSTFFFTINIPEVAAFEIDNSVAGPFWPVLTVTRAVLGNFEITDYPDSQAVPIRARRPQSFSLCTRVVTV